MTCRCGKPLSDITASRCHVCQTIAEAELPALPAGSYAGNTPARRAAYRLAWDRLHRVRPKVTCACGRLCGADHGRCKSCAATARYARAA